jgi:hypothetical protein
MSDVIQQSDLTQIYTNIKYFKSYLDQNTLELVDQCQLTYRPGHFDIYVTDKNILGLLYEEADTLKIASSYINSHCSISSRYAPTFHLWY